MSTPLIRRLRLVAAGLVIVAASVTPALPAQAGQPQVKSTRAQTFVSTGTVAGHLTDGGSPGSDSAGTPIPYATVLLYNADQDSVASTLTGPAGDYSLSGVPAGDYKLGFLLPGFFMQFAHQKLTFETADTISVAADAVTTVDEEVIPHGSLSGRVTTSTGAPAPYPYILVFAPDEGIIGQIGGDADGQYRLPYLPPGTYTVSFHLDSFLGPTEWAHQKRTQAEADQIVVAVGAQTTLDETFLPAGTITGHVTDGGAPVAGVYVSAQNVTTSARTSGYTDENGAYRVTAFPGTVKVEFDLPSGITQWAHQKTNEESADTVVVTAETDTIVDEQVIQPGTISGHLVNADGTPVPDANVEITDGATFQYATTDSSGAYRVSVLPGQYRVHFFTATQSQWAHAKLNAATADLITVTSGADTVVDDVLIPPGSLQVTATDSATGAPITQFCFSASAAISTFACTQNGTATINALSPDTYGLITSFDGDSDYLTTFTTGVQVRSGQTTSVAVKLRRGATLTVTARDSKTGAPVPNACLELIAPDQPSLLGGGGPGCTDATGKLTVRPIQPGTYNPFVRAADGVHAHQWVGPHGGVGAQADAKRLALKSGVTTNLTVKLDLPGSISGVVTDKTTGQPLADAFVGPSSWDDGFGNFSLLARTDALGRYTLNKLGPYRWTIFFRKHDHAAQWSGGGSNRLTAHRIRVKTGKTTTYNVALRKGTTLTGRLLGPDGQPFEGRVTVVNALSHDEMGSGDAGPDGVFTVPVLGPQPVKLEWIIFGGGGQGWYQNAADFAHAITVHIPRHGTKTVNIMVVPRPVVKG